jgi:hypothetical protein
MRAIRRARGLLLQFVARGRHRCEIAILQFGLQLRHELLSRFKVALYDEDPGGKPRHRSEHDYHCDDEANFETLFRTGLAAFMAGHGAGRVLGRAARCS